MKKKERRESTEKCRTRKKSHQKPLTQQKIKFLGKGVCNLQKQIIEDREEKEGSKILLMLQNAANQM